jgi:phenylalanyl-tRNA synthetase beta chain
MNSLVSYDWLKEFVDLKGIAPDEFAKRISLSGPAVEKILPQGKDLDKVVVGHVLEVKKHPNADKLRLAVVDVGSKVSIVCGGSNLVEDQWVAVALVGAKVKWHGEGDFIELQPVEIRGVPSEGMICAANEIGLFDAFPHEEREILDLGVALPEMKLKPGTLIADALGLSDDAVMDIEVTTNRVDAMGMVGMAREAAAILRRKFSWTPAKLPKAKGAAPKVKISAKAQCPRYMAVKMDGVKVGPSPWWMKRRLLSAGLRPINNLVDISNYVMLELAQPTHMFDASMVTGGIDVRLARTGEKLKALDGKDYEFDDSILVIADDEKPLAIAGVMGGEVSSVSSNTTSILIESATFEPVTIRRGARKLNIQSDAQLRFEKGLSTNAPPEALARIVELVQELAGGKLVSAVADVGKSAYKPLSFSVTTDEVNTLIGVPVAKTEMLDILRRLGFQLSTTGKKITAKVPWWRDHDIEDGRDLVEEIARVQGYANVPPVVPAGLPSRLMDKELAWEKHVRFISKGAGLTETYTYSFVSKDLLTKAEYSADTMLQVQNPLSVEFEVMRTTLLPSLLQVASENRERYAEQMLFEVANVYYPTDEGWKDLPDEQLELGALFMGMSQPWRVAKGYVEHLLAQMGMKELSWRRLSDDSFWHPGRSVQAFYKEDLVATLGEVSPRIAQNFKLDGPVALVDIPLEKVLPFATDVRVYTPPSPFPEAKRDLAVVVDARTEYAELAQTIRSIDSLVANVEWFDTYRGKNLPEGKKSVAMHITFSSAERTLESGEVDGLMEKATLALKEKFKAEVRA